LIKKMQLVGPGSATPHEKISLLVGSALVVMAILGDILLEREIRQKIELAGDELRWTGARAGLCGQKLHKMNATLEKVRRRKSSYSLAFANLRADLLLLRNQVGITPSPSDGQQQQR